MITEDGALKWPTGDVRMELSPEALASLPVRLSVGEDEIQDIPPQEQTKILILSRLYTQITGESMEILNARDVLDKNPNIEIDIGRGDHKSEGEVTRGRPDRAGYGLEYDYSSYHFESEKSTFSAQGVINTADGKTIDFSVELSMSREYMERQHISIREGDAVVKDPLVINYSGNAAELTETKFAFDLDADGNKEQISFVSPGSGFLAADFNGDNKVNDGSELFGPQSGDGFAELAKHDDDGNGWIDEGDTIYNKLRIWSKDNEGNDQLLALGKAGIGAIYLGNLNTEFSLKGSENQLLGEVVSSSIYLSEDGQAGTVQQINLVV